MKYRVSVREEIESIQIFEIEAESPEDAALKADLLREPERRCDMVSLRGFTVMEPEKSPVFGEDDHFLAYKVLAVFDNSDLEEINEKL